MSDDGTEARNPTRLHEKTSFDPNAEAIALVRKIEAVALDEEMCADVCRTIIQGLASRQQLAIMRSAKTHSQTLENTRALKLKSGVIGVQAADIHVPGAKEGNILQVVPDLRGLIPNKAR